MIIIRPSTTTTTTTSTTTFFDVHFSFLVATILSFGLYSVVGNNKDDAIGNNNKTLHQSAYVCVRVRSKHFGAFYHVLEVVCVCVLPWWWWWW